MKEENIITLDLNAILVDVIKLDTSLQYSIKRKVEENIINGITNRFLEDYFSTHYINDKTEIDRVVADKLAEDQVELIKKVVKGFTEKVRYYGKDKTQKATDKFIKSVEDYLKELDKNNVNY